MDQIVLGVVVSDAVKGELSEVAEALGLSLHVVSSVPEAKMTMLKIPPTVIVTELDVPSASSQVLRFCREMRGHASFSNIPLLLVVRDNSATVVKMCQDSGAQTVMPWPSTAGEMFNRIEMLVSDDMSASIASSYEDPLQDEQRLSLGQKSSAVVNKKSASEATFEEKMAVAQRLLAMALHNLKTTNLLEVASIDDVPRIVSEITRAVCGQEDSPSKTDKVAVDVVGEENFSKQLDAVFGLKKR